MNYQLTVLISNKLDDKKREGVLDDIVKDLGDKAKKDLWGVRGLAYPIKHEEKAFYAHFDFEAEPGVIPGIDRKLKLNEDIVRYLLIKIEKKADKKSKNKKAEIPTEDKKIGTAEEGNEISAQEEPSTEEVAAEVEPVAEPKAKKTKKSSK